MKQLNNLLPDQAELTFDDFYLTYPKKANKKKAEALWKKLSKSDQCHAVIDVPNRLKHHHQWNNKQYIPAPDVYLRNHKWNDDIVQAKTKEDVLEENEDGTVHSRLWSMLISFYGNKFTASFGMTMPKAWIYGLPDLTQEECKKILSYLVTDQSEFIPDLPKINRIRNIGKQPWRTDQKLIGNPAKAITVETELSKMMGMLR